jgi:chemotaxis response regulator CheB/chemotaxis methyl-accepting protein methylase
MSNALKEVVSLISQIVHDKTGNIMGPKQAPMIENRLKSRMVKLNLSTVEDYLEYLKNNQAKETDSLVSLMTTHHTFFFREFNHFEFLRDTGLPSIVKGLKATGEKKLRVWSAACSKGQEVYSLAMFLSVHLKALAPEMDFEVIGTDIDPESVQHAKNGIYPKEELKSIPQLYSSNHWKPEGSDGHFFKASSELKNKVKFQVENLLDLKNFLNQQTFHIILCRNVFIYFEKPQIESITKNFLNHLHKEGYLIVGVSESITSYGLALRSLGGSVYEKKEKASQEVSSLGSNFGTKLGGTGKGEEASSMGSLRQGSSGVVTPVVTKRNLQIKPYRVMVVDDSKTIHTLMKKVFTRDQGFEIVHQSMNGRDALEYIKKKPSDVELITLDLHMPELDGIGFLKEYQDRSKPILVVSAVDRDDPSGPGQTALKLGAFDYVEKPTVENLEIIANEIRSKFMTGLSLMKTEEKPEVMGQTSVKIPTQITGQSVPTKLISQKIQTSTSLTPLGSKTATLGKTLGSAKTLVSSSSKPLGSSLRPLGSSLKPLLSSSKPLPSSSRSLVSSSKSLASSSKTFSSNRSSSLSSPTKISSLSKPLSSVKPSSSSSSSSGLSKTGLSKSKAVPSQPLLSKALPSKTLSSKRGSSFGTQTSSKEVRPSISSRQSVPGSSNLRQRSLSQGNLSLVGATPGSVSVKQNLVTAKQNSLGMKQNSVVGKQNSVTTPQSLSPVTAEKIKTLIVDDSATVRKILTSLLSQDARFQVVGETENPLEVENLIRKLKPDLITLDIHMPDMDGVTLLKKYLPQYPVPTVMISSISISEGQYVLDALDTGAVDYIQKPSFGDITAHSEDLCERLFIASKARVKKVRTPRQNQVRNSGPKLEEGLIVIGSSTGGTEALRSVFEMLPEHIPPILVAQHIPAVFSKALADRLDGLVKFKIIEGADGQSVQSDHVYIAPGGKQMGVEWSQDGLKIRVTDEEPVNRHKPSVDYLFRSVARIYPKIPHLVGVILTGMGADGARELKNLRDLGATTIGQNEATCVVYGMPKVAFDMGGVEQQLPLDQIAQGIVSAFSKAPRKNTKAKAS